MDAVHFPLAEDPGRDRIRVDGKGFHRNTDIRKALFNGNGGLPFDQGLVAEHLHLFNLRFNSVNRLRPRHVRGKKNPKHTGYVHRLFHGSSRCRNKRI